MMVREGRWREVEPGNYVRDAKGVTWRVLSWNHSSARIRNKQGVEWTVGPDPYDAVKILTPTMDEAVSVVERILGGTVISEERTAL